MPQLLHLTEFILATGYKGEIIKKYFKKNKKFKTKIINTGLNTLTGSRLLRLKKYLNKDKIFMATYGDGLANIDIKKLYQFHSTHKKTATMTVVRPPVRFGEVKLLQNQVIDFKEKPRIKSKWINGGFFVFNRDIFKYLRKKNEMLETNPIERLTKKQKLMAYKHKGFWQCMDTERDKNFLKKLIKNKEAYWM